MKILFVDTKVTGHHMVYLNTLIEAVDDCSVIMCDKSDVCKKSCKVYQVQYEHNVKSYLKWLIGIKEIAQREKADIIHFLYGDIFYKFFGVGLKMFKNFKVIVTFHHMNFDVVRNVSLKKIFKRIDKGVVHTSCLKENLNKIGIKNAVHIEYPHFGCTTEEDKEASLKYFGLKPGIPVLGAIGGTRYDKGLDILLEALNSVNSEFQLLIAGKEEYFTKEFILDKCRNYSNNVKLYLSFLTEQELSMAFSAVDIIVLPYRKIFDGASGPLVDGVWYRKPIIAPNHGSIGRIITSNKIGITFQSENEKSLADKINSFFSNQFVWNDKAEEYRHSLSSIRFKTVYKSMYQIFKRDVEDCNE